MSERGCVPQGTVESAAVRAEGPICGAGAAGDADGEPPSSSPGAWPGDDFPRQR
jgi:hypothetical protein